MNTQIKNKHFLPTESQEYKAFLQIGFKFQNLKIEHDIITGKLICLCGKTETFTVKIKKTLKEHGKDLFDLTIKQFLLDDKHLLEDGYTFEQIFDIRNKYYLAQNN